MSDPMKDAWNEVAEGFSKLGTAMKDRYRGADPEAGDDGRAGAAPNERLQEAFERLVAAGRDVGQRAVDVLRDADVNAQAKQAATSLDDALSATVDVIGRTVSGWFGVVERSDPDVVDVDEDPQVVGVPEDVPEAVRPSATGLVTGPLDEAPDVVVAEVDVEADADGGGPPGAP